MVWIAILKAVLECARLLEKVETIELRTLHWIAD